MSLLPCLTVARQKMTESAIIAEAGKTTDNALFANAINYAIAISEAHSDDRTFAEQDTYDALRWYNKSLGEIALNVTGCAYTKLARLEITDDGPVVRPAESDKGELTATIRILSAVALYSSIVFSEVV